MAYPSVSNIFSNATTADATQVNTNFADLVAGLSDGSKDLNVNDIAADGITVSGAVSAANCTIGAAVTATSAHFATATVANFVATTATVSQGNFTSAIVGQAIIQSGLASGGSAITNAIYSNSIVKAWCRINSSGTQIAGFNIGGSRSTTGTYVFVFKNPMPDANYGVMATVLDSPGGGPIGISADNIAATSFTARVWDIGGATLADFPAFVCVYGS